MAKSNIRKIKNLPGCWNWQTGWTQNPLVKRPCGFKSHPGHSFIIKNMTEKFPQEPKKSKEEKLEKIKEILDHAFKVEEFKDLDKMIFILGYLSYARNKILEEFFKEDHSLEEYMKMLQALPTEETIKTPEGDIKISVRPLRDKIMEILKKKGYDREKLLKEGWII